MANNTFKVHVYESEDEYRVHPAVLEVDGDAAGGNPDRVIVRNHTTEDLVLYAGANVFAVGAIADPLPAGGKVTKTAKSQGNGNVKAVSYQLFGVKSGKRAKGNSDPVIIIEN